MRGKLLIVTALIVVAGCSKRESAADQQTVVASDRMGPPAIAPSAAPGVAFDYRYVFGLPDSAISAVQEAHASRCEAMGVAQCRITGLVYRVSDDNAVQAELDVKLAPDVARSFGKEATGAVVRAGGRLSETEFTGEDTAPATSAASSSQADANAQIAAIERQLPAAHDRERAELQSQLESLRRAAQDAKATIANQQQKLASTPMHFAYYGKGGVTGFNGCNPLIEAGRSFVASLVTMISTVLTALAILLPWALLLALIVAIFRSKPGQALRSWLFPRSGYVSTDGVE